MNNIFTQIESIYVVEMHILTFLRITTLSATNRDTRHKLRPFQSKFATPSQNAKIINCYVTHRLAEKLRKERLGQTKPKIVYAICLSWYADVMIWKSLTRCEGLRLLTGYPPPPPPPPPPHTHTHTHTHKGMGMFDVLFVVSPNHQVPSIEGRWCDVKALSYYPLETPSIL